MADDKRYRILKIKLHNAYLFGNDNALLTVVKTKRVLANYTVPFYLANNPDVSKEVDGVGIMFNNMQEWLKTVPCYGCGKKGNQLNKCRTTPGD